jgi:hypothetical protein
MMLHFAFEACVLVGKAIEGAPGPDGSLHRMIPIVGGTVEGPAFSGIVLPGGADWQRIRADGVAEIEARYQIQSHDGVVVQVVNGGFRHGSADAMRRLAAGARVDASEYYFRTVPRFHAPAGLYEWMSRTIFVAAGERLPDRVVLRFWSV